jgi:uncharacterized membrane protein
MPGLAAWTAHSMIVFGAVQIVQLILAYNNQYYKLPFVGDLAAKFSA